MSLARKTAPEIPLNLEWFNIAGPLELGDMRGCLVLLAFIDSSSLVCYRMLRELEELARIFRDQLLILIVHTPTLACESGRTHVQKFINRAGIRLPLLHDPEHAMSALYRVGQLPAQVLIDRSGQIIGSLAGAGKRQALEAVIRHRLGLRGEPRDMHVPRLPKRTAPEPETTLLFPGRISIAGERIYISDSEHHRILVLSRDGRVIRQYGAPVAGFVDGIGEAAAFSSPQGMSVADGFLFVADTGNHAIRRINLHSDEVVTVAGNGNAVLQPYGFRGDPLAASLCSPLDVVHCNGQLFIAVGGAHQVWKFSLFENALEVFAGSGHAGALDGRPGAACLAQPSGITTDGCWLYCTDALTGSVRRIDVETGYVDTLASGLDLPAKGMSGRAVATDALQYPQAIAFDPDRKSLWVADTYNNQVVRISPDSGRLSRLKLDRLLNEPSGLAFVDDTLYIVNTNLHEFVRANPGNGRVEVLNVSEDYNEV